jgi:hypothetical protein
MPICPGGGGGGGGGARPDGPTRPTSEIDVKLEVERAGPLERAPEIEVRKP